MANNSCMKTSPRRTQDSISFGNVQIRQYDVIIGDNPSTKKGPSIDIDWKYQQNHEIPIDTYESKREGVRRTVSKLFIAPKERMHRLNKWGYTNSEILTVQKEASAMRERWNKSRILEMNNILSKMKQNNGSKVEPLTQKLFAYQERRKKEQQRKKRGKNKLITLLRRPFCRQ